MKWNEIIANEMKRFKMKWCWYWNQMKLEWHQHKIDLGME